MSEWALFAFFCLMVVIVFGAAIFDIWLRVNNRYHDRDQP